MSDENVSTGEQKIRPRPGKPRLWIWGAIVAVLVVVAALVVFLLWESRLDQVKKMAAAAGMLPDAAVMKNLYPPASAGKLAAMRERMRNVPAFPDSAVRIGQDYPAELFNRWQVAQRRADSYLAALDQAVADGNIALSRNFEPAQYDSAGVNAVVQWGKLYQGRLAFMAEWGKLYQVIDYWQQLDSLFRVVVREPYLTSVMTAQNLFTQQLTLAEDLNRAGFFERCNAAQLKLWISALETDAKLLQDRFSAVLADEVYLQLAWLDADLVIADPAASGWKSAKAEDPAQAIDQLLRLKKVAGMDYAAAVAADKELTDSALLKAFKALKDTAARSRAVVTALKAELAKRTS